MSPAISVFVNKVFERSSTSPRSWIPPYIRDTYTHTTFMYFAKYTIHYIINSILIYLLQNIIQLNNKSYRLLIRSFRKCCMTSHIHQNVSTMHTCLQTLGNAAFLNKAWNKSISEWKRTWWRGVGRQRARLGLKVTKCLDQVKRGGRCPLKAHPVHLLWLQTSGDFFKTAREARLPL